MRREVTTYHLEMTDPRDLRPSGRTPVGVSIVRAETPSPEFARFLYTAVGGDLFWKDRLGWTYKEWYDYLDRPELELWVAYRSGTPAGYFELQTEEGATVKIVYFGLLPQFVGQGLGGHLLTVAIRRAWEMGASRVWIHTCSLDHPHALANYQARGLKVFREETHEIELPAESPGPWPQADRPADVAGLSDPASRDARA